MIKTRSRGPISTRASFKVMQPVGDMMLTSSMRNFVVGRRHELDAARAFSEPINLDEGEAKAANTNERRPPVGDRRGVINEPAQRLLHLRERPDGHEQSAKSEIAEKVSGRRHDDGRDDGKPAIARREPGQFRRCADESTENDRGANRARIATVPSLPSRRDLPRSRRNVR